MLNCRDVESVIEAVEADPVITEAQPKLRWIDILQALDVASPVAAK